MVKEIIQKYIKKVINIKDIVWIAFDDKVELRIKTIDRVVGKIIILILLFWDLLETPSIIDTGTRCIIFGGKGFKKVNVIL